MKKYIFIAGLILLLLNSFVPISALCEETSVNEDDPEVIKIKEGVISMMNSYIYQDREVIMSQFPQNATRLRDEAENDLKRIEKLSDVSCGDPKVLSYNYKNPKTRTVEFTIECSGFDYSDSKDVTLTFARRVTVNRATEKDIWQIVDSQEIKPSVSPKPQMNAESEAVE